MTVRHVSCGEFATEGERKAFERISNALRGLARHGTGKVGGSDVEWLVITNLNHVYDRRRRPDEIDMVVVGPTGVYVIEVKPWEHVFLNRNPHVVDMAAARTNDKAKRIKGTLACVGVDAFVTPRLLLTADSLRLDGDVLHGGVKVCGLGDWKALLSVEGRAVLGPDALDLAEQVLAASNHRRRTGAFASVGEIDFDPDDHVIDDSEAPFHRVWRGSHRRRQDKVIVHLYDLSARPARGERITELARRDFEAMQQVQHLDFVPRIYDSFTDHPEYPGEVAFFSLIDTLATPIVDRQEHPSWTVRERLDFALATLRAVDTLHRPNRDGVTAIVHRSLNPATVRVLSTNKPVLVGFGYARIPGSLTVSSAPAPIEWGPFKSFVAPEMQRHGLGEASEASDTYSVCATLMASLDKGLLPADMPALPERDEAAARDACALLERGKHQQPESREALSVLAERLAVVIGGLTDPAPSAAEHPLPAGLWDQAHEVSLGASRYRVIERLGEGGIGMTFKVVELDPRRGDELGMYVAKTIRDESDAEDAVRAYRLAKQHTAASQHIATIHEVAGAWSESAVMCLIEWIDGFSIDKFVGVMEIELEDRAAELGNETVATLLMDWMRQACEGLHALHSVNLVHGDVSPQNIMARGTGLFEVQLTDFDTVIEVGQKPRFRNPKFASQEVIDLGPVAKSDDIFALAAVMYAILTDRVPFDHAGTIDRARGLGWRDDDPWTGLRGFAALRQILDRATDPDRSRRYADANEASAAITDAVEALGYSAPEPEPIPTRQTIRVTPAIDDMSGADEDVAGANTRSDGFALDAGPIEATLSRQVNGRLRSLLAMFPGSRHGNDEARGLDSAFARETYVRTRLDTHMFELVSRNEVSLVLLFGNAGDGKTAFLQQLALALGAPELPVAAGRIWRGATSMGVPVMINFDGSASFEGKSADELLDDVFSPFQQQGYSRDRIHLVAVNSGKLLEWVEIEEDRRQRETWLTRQLRQAMDSRAGDDDEHDVDPRIRLIDLNARSLVGCSDPVTGAPSREFLDTLIDRFVGTDDPSAWAMCRSCIAQERCPAYGTVTMLKASDEGPRIRERLGVALEACHQRGAMHITSRDLRGTLSYVFFGLHSCEEIHDDPADVDNSFWNRAFDASSTGRQGALLDELARLDPANECDPETDRLLLDQLFADTGQGRDLDPKAFREARRRAWFNDARTDGSPTVSLVDGRHQNRFREVAHMCDDRRHELVADLCGGLARLEDLPVRAFAFAERRGEVPFRISPRTPTETILWTATPLNRFRLSSNQGWPNDRPFDQLHTSVTLAYCSPAGDPLATLMIDLKLFDLLLKARVGMQMTSSLQAGIFANLEAFAKRLAREGSRRLSGWHPSKPNEIFSVRIEDRNQRHVIVRRTIAEDAADAG